MLRPNSLKKGIKVMISQHCYRAKNLLIIAAGGAISGNFIMASFVVKTLVFTPTEAMAQIVPDATLPTNSNVNQLEQTWEITGGTVRGDNLFHSFDEFSLPSGNEAFFNQAGAIENIFTRVTGRSLSNINGTIRANGAANLFLINPNGIQFGENARLQIGGSFLGSSASRFLFENGTEFSATNPQAPPLLTINSNLSSFEAGTGGGITLEFDENPGNISSESAILEVEPGKTLALFGGNITLESSNLIAPGGRIELGSIAGAGSDVSVGLIRESTLPLSPEGESTFGNIQLSGTTTLDVSDDQSGAIQLWGSEIFPDRNLPH
jgi:filamentous hemagglutinin family protein